MSVAVSLPVLRRRAARGDRDAHNVRRAFRQVVAAAGLDAHAWTPRELRHSFVSLLSASGVRNEDNARLVGHSATGVTERAYRHQLHAVLDEGTTAMDDIFPLGDAGIVTQLFTQSTHKIAPARPGRPGERGS